VIGESSKLELRIPRDREGSFDPKLIAKYQRRFPGFDAKIISMYARGMSVREIQGHLVEIYGLDVSPDLISTVTDAVLETVAEWQNRPLEASYPIMFFDAMRVKIRDDGLVRNKAQGDRLVLLVGDEAYYGRSGLKRVPPGQITMPGPVDPMRLLVRELADGALAGTGGKAMV